VAQNVKRVEKTLRELNFLIFWYPLLFCGTKLENLNFVAPQFYELTRVRGHNRILESITPPKI
jgi:hypothetical protein